MIRIRSKRHNFRRCGMPHPKEPVDYPDDRFTKKELATLKAETMLIVEVIETGNSKLETGITETEIESESEEVPEESKIEETRLPSGRQVSIDTITVAQIKAELDARGIEYDDKARKPELFEIYRVSNGI